MKPNLLRIIYLFLIFLRSSGFWFITALLRPEQPLSVTHIYRERGQDTEYFPYVTGLMEHGLRDAFDYVAQGTGVVSFPFGSVWLHSILFKVLGSYGFMLADFLIASASFLLLTAILKEFKVRDFIAQTVSVLVVVGLFGKMAGLSKGIFSIFGDKLSLLNLIAFIAFAAGVAQYFFRKKVSSLYLLGTGAFLLFIGAQDTWEFFTWRFPRPFVTVVYFLAFILLMLRMQNYASIFDSKKEWILSGVVAAILLQSDIYTFFFCGLLFTVLSLSALKKNLNWPEAFKSVGAFLLPFIVLSVPFMVQRLYENKDVPRRYGLYPISHLTPHLKDISLYDFYFLTLIAFLIFYVFKKLKESGVEERFLLRRQSAIFWAYVMTFFAMPLMSTFSGQMIIPGHFYDHMRYVTTLIFIIGFAMLCSSRPVLVGVRSKVALLLVMGIALVNIAKDVHKNFKFADHTRSDFAEYQVLPRYQQNFTGLVKFLQNPEISAKSSIATFDMQAAIWWMTFKKGVVFNTDVFSSSLPDVQIENRLTVIGRLLGMTGDEFVKFIDQRMVHIFFFTCMKYQFHKGHQYSSLDDYLPEDLKGYDSTSFLSSFNVAIPISERNRLKAKFDAYIMPEAFGQPDLMILQGHPMLDAHVPEEGAYEKVFSNEVFRVYKKKAPARS